ncbi:hypothetical protein LCGC14_1996220, partial [marine sediment metagenome]
MAQISVEIFRLSGSLLCGNLQCGPQKAGERLLTYKGEVFGSRFMTRTYTSYCPACLLDDAIKEANGNRV